MDLYLYKQFAEKIIYHMQTKLQMHLPDDLRNDVFSNVLNAVMAENEKSLQIAEKWYKEYCDLKKKGFPINWNEMKIRIAREKEPIEPELILKWMLMRENDLSIRGLIPNDDELLKELMMVN